MDKLVAPEKLESLCNRLRNEGARIVFTNGVFDLLHPGHITYLEAARKLGTHLFVALNSDESTRRIKGSLRPFIPLIQRLEVLSAFECVSYVTWFDEDTPAAVIRKVTPAFLVKGGDWNPDQIVGKDFVEAAGGQVLNIPFVSGWSTTKIVERILASPDNRES